jgi:hypothetical protein
MADVWIPARRKTWEFSWEARLTGRRGNGYGANDRSGLEVKRFDQRAAKGDRPRSGYTRESTRSTTI